VKKEENKNKNKSSKNKKYGERPRKRRKTSPESQRKKQRSFLDTKIYQFACQMIAIFSVALVVVVLGVVFFFILRLTKSPAVVGVEETFSSAGICLSDQSFRFPDLREAKKISLKAFQNSIHECAERKLPARERS